MGAGEAEAVARVHDQRFALDKVLAGAWGAQVDRARIVAIMLENSKKVTNSISHK